MLIERNEELGRLLQRSAGGDAEAFEQLYRATSGVLMAQLLRMLQDHGTAEDLLQESYLRIWRSAISYHRERGPVLAWMITITRNAALDLLRSRRHAALACCDELVSEGPGTLTDPLPGPAELASDRDQLNQVAGSMASLSERERQSFLLAYYEGMTHEEIAARLRVPVGTVKSWLRRGLQKLRAGMGVVCPASATPRLRAVPTRVLGSETQRLPLPGSSPSLGRETPAVMTKRMASSKLMSTAVR